MAIELSLGAMEMWLTDTGFQGLFQGGAIYIYGSPRPGTPESGISEPPVAIITQGGGAWQPYPNNAAGLQLDMVAGTFLQMSGEWVVSGLSNGAGVWWRWVGPNVDYGDNSSTHPRIDGDCGSDLVLQSYSFTPSSTEPLERFVVGLPRNIVNTG